MQQRRGPGGRPPHTAEETREWRGLSQQQRQEQHGEHNPAHHLAERVALARLQAKRRAVNERIAELQAAAAAGVRTGTTAITEKVVAGASLFVAGVATTASTMRRVSGFAGRARRVCAGRQHRPRPRPPAPSCSETAPSPPSG